MMYVLCRARKMAALFLLAPLVLSPARAVADSLFYQFTNVFAGSQPNSQPAWVSSYFSEVKPGTVQLKISANGLTDGNFLSALFFNLDPSLKPSKLTFTYVGGSGGFTLPTISTGADAFKADDQGKFDVYFSFSQRAGSEFTGNDYAIYNITSSAFTLTAADFDYLSNAAGGCSEYLAAAEISGISGSCDTTGTGWVAPGCVSPVPEPAVCSLLVLGGGFCAAMTVRRRLQAGSV
jgi:hypothetical protein